MNTHADKAVELFSSSPKFGNCAQCVAKAFGADDSIVSELSVCGGGRAPEGLCGALYAAMLLADDADRPALRAAFRDAAGAETCRKSRAHARLLVRNASVWRRISWGKNIKSEKNSGFLFAFCFLGIYIVYRY